MEDTLIPIWEDASLVTTPAGRAMDLGGPNVFPVGTAISNIKTSASSTVRGALTPITTATNAIRVRDGANPVLPSTGVRIVRRDTT